MRASRLLLAVAAALLVAAASAGCNGGDGGDGGAERSERAGDPPTSGPGGGGLPEVVAAAEVVTAAPMPLPRTEVAGTAWEGGVVVVGGLTADGSVASRADVWRPGDDAWEALPDLPMPLHHTAVVAAGGRAWVVGGYTTGTGGSWRPTASVFSLGPGEEAWRPEPDLATPRGALAAAADSGDRIVAAGGVGPGGDVLDSAEVLEPGAGSWQPGPSMATAREHFAMAADGADVYAIAGRAGGLDTNIDSVEVLRDGSWEPAGTLARARGGIGAAVVRGLVCVAGGEEPGGTIAEVECRREGEWLVVVELATPRHGLAVAGRDGALHVVGGGPEPGLHVSDAHEVVELLVG